MHLQLWGISCLCISAWGGGCMWDWDSASFLGWFKKQGKLFWIESLTTNNWWQYSWVLEFSRLHFCGWKSLTSFSQLSLLAGPPSPWYIWPIRIYSSWREKSGKVALCSASGGKATVFRQTFSEECPGGWSGLLGRTPVNLRPIERYLWA